MGKQFCLFVQAKSLRTGSKACRIILQVLPASDQACARLQINSQKKKTGIIAPRRFVQRLKRDNELFRSYMHQVGCFQPTVARLLDAEAAAAVRSDMRLCLQRKSQTACHISLEQARLCLHHTKKAPIHLDPPLARALRCPASKLTASCR